MNTAADHARGTTSWLKRLWPLLLLIAAMAFVLAMGWQRYLTPPDAGREPRVVARADRRATCLEPCSSSSRSTRRGGAVAAGRCGAHHRRRLSFRLAAGRGGLDRRRHHRRHDLFLIARSALGDFLAARAGPCLSRFRAGISEDAFSYLLFLRLVPIFPFWLVNLAPALLGVSFGTYVATTILGIIPGTFAYRAGRQRPRQRHRGASKLSTNPALPRRDREAKSFAHMRSIRGRF